MPPVKIVSWNVASLIAIEPFVKHEHGGMKAWLDSMAADIVCIQETKLNPSNLTASLQSYLHPVGWTSYWSVGSKPGYCGVAVFIKDGPWSPPFAVYTDVEILRDDDNGEGEDISKEGRLVVVDMKAFVLFSVYIPNSGEKGVRRPFKLRFAKALYNQMEELRSQGRSIILCGDLNMIADYKIDQHPTFHSRSSTSSPWFHQALVNYADTYRELHPNEIAYTFWAQIKDHRNVNFGYRIDYVLISRDLLPKLTSAEIFDALKSTRASDHAAVSIILDVDPPTAEDRSQAKRQPGCVMEKVNGLIILKKCAPDKTQKSLKAWFTKGGGGGRGGGGKASGSGGSSSAVAVVESPQVGRAESMSSPPSQMVATTLEMDYDGGGTPEKEVASQGDLKRAKLDHDGGDEKEAATASSPAGKGKPSPMINKKKSSPTTSSAQKKKTNGKGGGGLPSGAMLKYLSKSG